MCTYVCAYRSCLCVHVSAMMCTCAHSYLPALTPAPLPSAPLQRVFAKEKEDGERRVLALIQRGTKVSVRHQISALILIISKVSVRHQVGALILILSKVNVRHQVGALILILSKVSVRHQVGALLHTLLMLGGSRDTGSAGCWP